MQQRSGTQTQNIYDEQSNTPGWKNANVRIMLYIMKHLFMGCVKVYLKLAEQNEPMLKKPARTPYLADDDKNDDEGKEPKGKS